MKVGLGLSFVVQSNNSYKIIISQKSRILGRMLVKMIPKEHVSLQIDLNPSFPRTMKKQLEKMLPVREEKRIPVKDMTEMICRFIWILCHTN